MKQKYETDCEWCSKHFSCRQTVDFVNKYPDKARRFCSMRCMQDWRSVPKVEITCELCGTKKLIHRSSLKYGKHHHCSKTCSSKAYSVNYSGENHPFYKGDRAMDRKFRTDSQPYRKWRKFVLSRDNYTCIWCGATDTLEVDHIRPKSLFPELVFEISNGRTLCHPCHMKTPTYGKTLTKEEYEML